MKDKLMRALSWEKFLNEAGVPTTFASEKDPGEDNSQERDVAPAVRKEEAEEIKTLISKDDYNKFVEELGELAKDSKVQNLISNGLKDGVKDEDRLYVSHATVKVNELIPTQREIDIDKSLRYPLTSVACAKMYIQGENVKIAGMDIVTLNSKYVIDGHHRWSQVYAVNPFATMSAKDISGISDPIQALKSLQIAIVADIGEVPVNNVEGSNMILSTEEEIVKYVKEKTTDEVMDVYRDAHIANDREELGKFIWKNVQNMQKENRPIENAPERNVMPQTDDAKNALDLLSKGKVNLKEPFIKERASSKFSDFLLEENKKEEGILTLEVNGEVYRFISVFKKGKKGGEELRFLLEALGENRYHYDGEKFIFYIETAEKHSGIVESLGSNYNFISLKDCKELSPMHIKFKNYNYYYFSDDISLLKNELKKFKDNRKIFHSDTPGLFTGKYRPTFTLDGVKY
jgi:hypothetical protein